jgi:hypothetical protein
VDCVKSGAIFSRTRLVSLLQTNLILISGKKKEGTGSKKARRWRRNLNRSDQEAIIVSSKQSAAIHFENLWQLTLKQTHGRCEEPLALLLRVARWFVSYQKWVNFGGPCNGRCWYFNGHFFYFAIKWYILWPFWYILWHLVHFSRFGMFGPRKIWQPCAAAAASGADTIKLMKSVPAYRAAKSGYDA